MSETPQHTATGAGNNPLNNILRVVARGETALAIGILCILAVFFLPIPTWLLDMSLALSITISVVILMLVMFIEKPLELSSFPSILLIATALRLSLNIASTRLILFEGHTGKDAAGDVIKAFGQFIIQDSYVIGAIVFGILVIVNFVVITKGSGRIAEVAARFSLDAMPGKQMAIDADLSSGLIDEDEARTRRSELEQESTFFGTMDGAAKFVRGDAIAGLMIVFINVIGGIVIGTAFNNMSVSDAAQTYTILTIGDGLVSQIPALIISISAGLLVTKAGTKGSAETILIKQFSRYPKALTMSGGLMMAMAIVPGIPALPFFTLGIISAGLGWAAKQGQLRQEEEDSQSQEAAEGAEAPVAEQPISRSLAMDTLRLELGYGLLPLVNAEEGNRLTDQIKGLRRQMAEDMGFVMPSVRIQDNLQLPANTYILRIKEIEAGRGEVRADMMLCMDPNGKEISLPGEKTVEPTFGLPAMWIPPNAQEEAHFKGYTVVDPATVITTHLTEIVKDNMSELLSYSETQKLLDEMDEAHQKLVSDVIPTQMSAGGLQRILQNLVAERVSIRDMATILEGILEASAHTKNIVLITEHVRTRLGRQICNQNANPEGFLPIVTLSPDWEQAFAESLMGDNEDRQLAMPPSKLQEFMTSLKESFDTIAATHAETPVLLTSPVVRPYVRSVIERFRPQTMVMSQNEIYSKAKIKTMGQI